LEIPFLFQTGETLLNTGGTTDSTESNIYDACLLESKRIGHGYSLLKHPHLLPHFREAYEQPGICIEVCPISNELLHLCRNIKEHPFPQLLSDGVPKMMSTKSTRPILHKDDVSTPSQVFEIPSYLDQKHLTNALGDYCAKFNFMREDYALRLGLRIDRHQTRKVTIGSGKAISTAGTATTTFRFQDKNESYPLIFHLLPNCIHNVILGKSFLKATSTFSNLKHFVGRVRQRIMKGITQHHLLYLGDSAPRFQGLINGISQEALADSGAKVMIMDEDYARNIGLYINSGSEHRTKLRFADNSTAYTSGIIHGVEWEFGLGEHSNRHFLDFYVLKNAPANVILSDTFLFGTEAFSQYNCYLVDDDDDDDDVFFFAIDIDTSHLNQREYHPPTIAQAIS
jgi:hypothetical protein